ncbi:MAG: 50S ribosomal protein L18, partial [Leptospiraceae bacterium]|nr:50S ribosomal protein L18 [Leptospiraceae bacterium]
MLDKTKIKLRNERRTRRIRYKLKKNGSRLRLVFNKTNRYLLAQVIDDEKGITLVQAATYEKDFPFQTFSRKNKKCAAELGKRIAQRAKAKGITKVMLDRSGMIY